MNRRRITPMMIIPLMVLALIACESAVPTGPGMPLAYPTFVSSPLPVSNPDMAYAAAQATLASGQSQMMELSHRATEVNMNMEQAASAAARTTLDYSPGNSRHPGPTRVETGRESSC